MSMMDAMSMGAQPPADQGAQAPAPAAAPGGQPPAPEAQQFMRMGGEDPQEMQALFNRVMSLISGEIWEGNGADMVADQMMQDESTPVEIVGKFTGFYLMMATAAARGKGGMLPPIVVVGAAQQVAAQLTDIGLMLKVVSPDNADDTADAGALIGLEVLIQNAGNQMQQDERQEYTDIASAIIKASPNAEQLAEEGADDAVEDVQEMQGLGGDEENNEGDTIGGDGVPESQMPPQGAGGGMAAAMGGQ